MKTFILAAGCAERWNGEVKQLSIIRDEPLLTRTLNMLSKYTNDVSILTHREELLSKYDNCIIPKDNSTLLQTVQSSSIYWNCDDVCFLLGDVVFTESALEIIFKNNDKGLQFYGSFDEQFAFKFSKHWYQKVLNICKLSYKQKWQGTIWQLYRSLVGIPVEKDWTERWFRTWILDGTDDIDYPEDYKGKIVSKYYDDPKFNYFSI